MYSHSMRSRSQVTAPEPARPRTKSVTLVRDMTHATIRSVPRGPRKVNVSDELLAFDKLVREFELAEARATKLREQVLESMVTNVRAEKLTIAEAARRTGYSREHLSRYYTDANKRDGWTPPPKKQAEETADA